MGLSDMIPDGVESSGGRDTHINYDNTSSPEDYDDYIKGHVAGLVIGEGSFIISVSRRSSRTVPFIATCHLKLNMADYSTDTVRFLAKFFGCGNLTTVNRKKESEADNFRFKVDSMHDHKEVVIPFFEQAFSDLPFTSDKERAFNVWKEVAKRNKDGRKSDVSTKDVARFALLSAYAKTKVNQITHGHSHVTSEEVEEAVFDEFPELQKESEEIKSMVDGWSE